MKAQVNFGELGGGVAPFTVGLEASKSAIAYLKPSALVSIGFTKFTVTSKNSYVYNIYYNDGSDHDITNQIDTPFNLTNSIQYIRVYSNSSGIGSIEIEFS